MSTANDSDRSEWRRDDWWGNPEVRTAADDHREHGTEWSKPEVRDDKAACIAHQLLRGVAPALCQVSIVDPEKEATELTEPSVYPHGEGNREHMRKARVNEEDGYISGGESTGVVLGDLPSDEFFDVVEILLAVWQKTQGVSEKQATILMRDARRMKSDPDLSDEETIRRLVRDVIEPGAIGEQRAN